MQGKEDSLFLMSQMIKCYENLVLLSKCCFSG